MNEPVFAWTEPGAPERLRWRADDGSWQSGSYVEFAATLGPRECIVLVDGTALTLLVAELPASDLRTARQALPYAVEERLAEPVEGLHFALARLADGRYAVAALAMRVHAAIVAALAEAGLAPLLVTSEYHALPEVVDGWTVQLADEAATFRIGQHIGIKLLVSELAAVLPLLRQEYPHTGRVIVYGAPPADWPEAALIGLEVEWRPPLTAADMLAALEHDAPLVLLEAAQGTATLARARRLWRAVAALALVTALAYPALLAMNKAEFARQGDELGAANARQLRETFPAITRVVNPRVQADQALAALRGQVDSAPRFLDLLSALDTLGTAGFPPGTRIAHASFSNGVLELGIETTGMGAVESVRTALQAHGLNADMLSAESGEDKVVARLRVAEDS